VHLSLPAVVETANITTMAILNDDGTLTPVPTRIDADGNVIVLLHGNVTLVPLSVEASFVDIDMGQQFAHVADEINRAASLMIVQGVGDGEFNPAARVTGLETATMFLRALGIPAAAGAVMDTAAELGLTEVDPAAPMSRIATAELIVNALVNLEMNPMIPLDTAREYLAQYHDLADLSDDEAIAMAVCVGLRIFQGTGGAYMNPNDTLQRSQMASLAVRMQDVILMGGE